MSDSWPLAIMRRRGGEPPPAARVVRPVGVESAIDAFREAAKTGLRIVPLGGRSAVTGAIVGLAATGFGRMRFEEPLPFGPFLALGGLIGMFAGPAIIHWYLHAGL